MADTAVINTDALQASVTKAKEHPPILRNLKSEGLHGLSAEFHNVPASFVNGIRRILTGETPVLRMGNIQVLENTSSMVHEQLKHRLSELPLRMRPTAPDWEKVSFLLDVTVGPTETTRDVMTADIQVTGAPVDILMPDKDFGDPILILKLASGQSVKVTAGLEVDPAGSLVCPATMSFLPDAERNSSLREQYVQTYPKGADQTAAGLVYDNHYAQQVPVPNAFRFAMETDGTVLSKALLRETVIRLRAKVDNWYAKHVIEDKALQKDSLDHAAYMVHTPNETHTLGALLQEVLAAMPVSQVKFVSYDQPHPLVQAFNLRMALGPDAESPQAVLGAAHGEILRMCDEVLRALEAPHTA